MKLNNDSTSEILISSQEAFADAHPDYNADFMRMATDLSVENVKKGGGPFGAVIVRDGKIIATGVNGVTRLNDPTAHAEVQAIRAACNTLGDFSLKGCTVYSSCEPCPMCLSALYWAGVDRIYFGNTQQQADSIGFSDQFIYEELARPRAQRHLPCIHVPVTHAADAFKLWEEDTDKIPY